MKIGKLLNIYNLKLQIISLFMRSDKRYSKQNDECKINNKIGKDSPDNKSLSGCTTGTNLLPLRNTCPGIQTVAPSEHKMFQNRRSKTL